MVCRENKPTISCRKYFFICYENCSGREGKGEMGREEVRGREGEGRGRGGKGRRGEEEGRGGGGREREGEGREGN